MATAASGAPALSITAGPDGPDDDNTPTFEFATDVGATVECSIDQGTPSYEPCTGASTHTSSGPLADGDYTFRVRATDAIPEATTEIRAFSIDTVAPTAAITFGATGTTNDDSPLFEFSVTGASTVECSIDQGTPAFGGCSSAGSHGVTQRLDDGAYTFRVRAADAAGNVASATRSFTVATGVFDPPVVPPVVDPPVVDPPVVSPPAAQAAPPQPTPTIASAPRLLSPFPLVRLAGGLTRGGAKVQLLTIEAPLGALVQVRVQRRCDAKSRRAPRCRAKLASGTVGAKRIVRFKRLELSYPTGTTIEIRVSQTGLIGKYTRFQIRRGKAPKRQDRCLMPGAKLGSTCPTA